MRHYTKVLVFAVAAWALSPALGVVGPNDRCPLPTPYPPVSAGAGAIHNASMEGGFTSGVANQWVAWKDATYTGQVHAEGTEHASDGSRSQKLTLPQPPPTYSGQEAGLYQQIWVTPGATYTASARFYLTPPPQQAYNGEDLVAWLGLDPFGQTSGDGPGMSWSVSASAPGVWGTLNISVNAVLPVMTLSVKGTRKYAQHGDSATVWIDQVVFSGPIPTGQRPGPEPDPVDPETLIPATSGANLVANLSFEETFANGVCAGWSKWSTQGVGTWKRSQRVGKVGGGRYDCGSVDALAQMNPKTILLYGGEPSASDPNNHGGNGVYGDVNYLATNYPNLEDMIVVGRPVEVQFLNAYRNDPILYGRRLADQLSYKQQEFPRIDCWQGLNEPDSGDSWQQVVAFEKAFAERLHELGMKSCSLNLSTGSPGNIWRMVDETFAPSCKDLLAVADYLGQHCYGGPNDDLMLVNQNRDDACSFALRPRRFRDMYARRGWRYPPLIATEGSTYGPNVAAWGDTMMSNDLVTMGQYMNVTKWWCGYTNFVVGGSCGWSGFEISNRPAIISAVGTQNANYPADAANGLYSQMFGAGKVHPKTLPEMTPAGQFTGGINQPIGGLTPGTSYLLMCWMKYEFRGHQPTQLKFHLGVDPTGQTSNPAAATIDWGADQIADKATIHEIFTHIWRTFTPTSATASIWLRAGQTVADPSFMVYVDQVEVRQIAGAVPQPTISRSPATITQTISQGTNASSQTFAVQNVGVGTLSYTVTDDAGWLNVSPSTGTSTGETDTLAVSYATTALSAGSYSATITISDPAAGNSPQTITVNLTIQPATFARADFDRDGDVDQTDFGHFQECLSGRGTAQSEPWCLDARLDADSDVDEDDASVFIGCLSGPDVAANPACAP